MKNHKNYVRILLVFLFLLLNWIEFTGGAHLHESKAQSFSYDQEVTEAVKYISEAFKMAYAPTEWKKEQFQWDIDTQINLSKSAIAAQGAELSRTEGQKIIRQFVESTKDYHVSVQFYGTEKATLPLEIRSAENHYYIVWIDREKLSEKSFPVKVGDEVVSLGNQPVAELVQELQNTMVPNTPVTDHALAELFITRRVASRGMTVPQGPVDLVVERSEVMAGNSEKEKKHEEEPKSVKTIRHQLLWNYVGEVIKERSKTNSENTTFLAQEIKGQGVQSQGQQFKWLNRTMTMGSWTQFKEYLSDIKEDPFLIGGKKSFIPLLSSTVLSEGNKESSFYSYIFKTKKGVFGYVRIPSYSAGEKEAKEFQEIIKKMQAQTDALVIDQVNNPGGSVFYLAALASMLTDKPLATPQHRIALIDSEVQDAYMTQLQLEKISNNDDEAKKVLGETLDGYPVNAQVAQFFLSYSHFIIHQNASGKRITDPYFLGIDKIHPHPETNYTKPILVLTNELDFSGGDFFPAILQDNKRATIMGTRTAGAGGFIRSFETHYAGIEGFSVTGSIAERVNLRPIENLGVTPDVAYNITSKDRKDNYESYAKEIVKQLELLKESDVSQ